MNRVKKESSKRERMTDKIEILFEYSNHNNTNFNLFLIPDGVLH